MTSIDRQRRQAILVILLFANGHQARVADLQRALETMHNHSASRDQIRGDLGWLASLGHVALHEDLALLTESGQDVAQLRAQLPPATGDLLAGAGAAILRAQG